MNTSMRRAGCAVAGWITCGCSTTLSTMQPAEPVGKNNVHVGVGANVNLPVSRAWAVLEESTSTTARVIASGDPPSEDDARKLFDAGLALGLNPPGTTPDIMLRYGVLDSVDIGARFSGNAIHGDVKGRFFHSGDERWSGAISLGYSNQRFSGAAFDVLDVLEMADYSRHNVELPILFGARLGDYGHVWFGPKFVGSFYSLDASLKSTGLVAHSSGFIQHWGMFGGAALGYKHVFAFAELTTMYMIARPEILGREVNLGGVVIMPSAGLMARF